MNFSFEQLLSFVTVWEERSFSKAAVKLNKHRTTVGQVVTNLEDQLAVSLFERVGRTVVPTEDGNLLYHYAKQAVEQARIFDKVALSLSFGGLESVTFAYPSFVPHNVLSDIRIQLAKDFPLMRVNFIVRSKEDIKRGIQEGIYHFGLVNIHESTAINSLDSTFLGHVEFLPFVKKSGRFSNLSPEEAFSNLRNERQFILRTFIEEGLSEKVTLSSYHEEVDQLALAIKLVGEDLGWALLPAMLSESAYATENIESINVAEILAGIKIGVALWSPHSKQINDVKKSILDVLNRYVIKLKSRQ